MSVTILRHVIAIARKAFEKRPGRSKFIRAVEKLAAIALSPSSGKMLSHQAFSYSRSSIAFQTLSGETGAIHKVARYMLTSSKPASLQTNE